MQPFVRLDAIAAPLPIANVDTDKILAGRFLKTISRAGLGDKLFWSLRQDPHFVLNHAPWDKSGILVSHDNFGCGSSREHAPWALLDFGIRCIIAPSIADIFYNNCFKNGILPIILPQAQVAQLIVNASDASTARMTVDLAAQTIDSASQPTIHFEVEPRRKADLLDGVDEIDRSLREELSISAYETRHRKAQPWIGEIGISYDLVELAD
jgi:3-isopropylmalate/(R)-2-methylmalate dehydratase small subunit